MNRSPDDPRVQQTRCALLGAFNGLILHRSYDRIHVDDIAHDAGVGRSTFYEHFRNKDELFRHSVSAVLVPLADATTSDAGHGALAHMLQHVRQNIRATRALLCGEPGVQVCRRLAELIEPRLAERFASRGTAPLIPVPLVAAQIAEMQLGLLRAWLSNHHDCDALTLADAIGTASRAVADSQSRPAAETRV